MAGIKWVQQLLEIEQRESARQQLLRNHAQAIFDMLKTEVARCIEAWNAAPRAGGKRLLVVDAGAEDEAFTIAVRDPDAMCGGLKLTYKVMDARLDFEVIGKPNLLKGTATIELDESVTSGIQGRYTPVFTIRGQPGQLGGVPELVEYLLKPMLFTSDMIAKLPPAPLRSCEPLAPDRDAERRRAAATQPLV